MDPAQVMELQVLRHQEPMNAVLEKGDSPVQQYYNGTTVFVTGGSGFIGKQLIEKLFRACAIKKLYLLTRAKKGKSIQQRLEYMLEDPVFERVRSKQPNFANKIVAVEGDVAEIRLGLSHESWSKLADEVNVIFHVAATIRFDEPLVKAVLTNIRGTRETISLAKHCSKLKKFVHVSTAFSHATMERIDTDLYEQFYPCPVPPESMISLAEEMSVDRINNITPELIKGWPNTYTFTKALAEELIRVTAGDLPICIVRPPIVLPAHYEPNPGWIDITTVVGPSGVYLGGGLGVLRVFRTDVSSNLLVAPVDYVNNLTIAAGWESDERRKNGQTDIPIYTIYNNLRYGRIGETMRCNRDKYCSTKCVWWGEMIETKSRVLYFLLSWFYHFIPAYFIDFVLKLMGKKLPKGIDSVVGVYKMVDKLADIYDYFISNDWYLKDDNTQLMMKRMAKADKAIFNCDITNLDMNEYIITWGLGLRKYIMKDGLVGSNEAYRKQQILKVIHYIVLLIYCYILYFIASTIFSILMFLVNLLF